ncbi:MULTISPECIES: hypothetical protein [unclassified Actinotalea]|uniref:LolA family protein n=1 Tax=unclassified Actinotalea TaxID=2638618 RepID=UPI0015F6C60D|nr:MULTISPECIES: hypothetical protein [unclassified Actinotalea]
MSQPTVPAPDVADTPRSARRRWAVPAVVAAGAALAFAAPPLLASAGEEGLPEVTAEELLAAVASAEPQALSGTVVYTARLGLPEIPFAEAGGADPIALLGGSSTLRVWTDGDDRSRVALLGATSEYSVVRDGPEAWTYSSEDDEVVHYGLSEADAARYEALAQQVEAGPSPEVAGDLPTPQEAAAQVLAYAEESSTVSVDGTTTIAGRGAYQLVVTPRTQDTLVARVVVGVDAETSTPLRVQAWSTQDDAAPALEVGFTDLDLGAPDDAVLAFSPPAGAQQRDVVVPLPVPDEAALPGADAPEHADVATEHPDVTVHGSGWASVAEVAGVDVASLVAGDPAALATLPEGERTIGSPEAQELLQEFEPGDGSGGGFELDPQALYDQLTTEVPEGRLLSSALLSVLVTHDGRVLVGAVPADTLRALA